MDIKKGWVDLLGGPDEAFVCSRAAKELGRNGILVKKGVDRDQSFSKRYDNEHSEGDQLVHVTLDLHFLQGDVEG